jgi:hypothetical protein
MMVHILKGYWPLDAMAVGPTGVALDNLGHE